MGYGINFDGDWLLNWNSGLFQPNYYYISVRNFLFPPWKIFLVRDYLNYGRIYGVSFLWHSNFFILDYIASDSPIRLKLYNHSEISTIPSFFISNNS